MKFSELASRVNNEYDITIYLWRQSWLMFSSHPRGLSGIDEVVPDLLDQDSENYNSAYKTSWECGWYRKNISG